jgi:glycosyltransferase involved in cell wall biosynthesis
MIPTFNPRKDLLGKTLCSVLGQNLDTDEMEIVVVDDCSTAVDVEATVRPLAGHRVICMKTPQNLGLAGCWNASIEQARGQWVHILHQDDYILPGFYERFGQVAQSHPEVGLIATRSFFVNDEGVIDRVTRRSPLWRRVVDRSTIFCRTCPSSVPGSLCAGLVMKRMEGFGATWYTPLMWRCGPDLRVCAAQS